MYDAVSNSGKGRNSSAIGNPENAATIQGKTQEGRSVQQQQTVTQLSDQMAAVSIADQQSSGSCTPEKASPLITRQVVEECKQEAEDTTKRIVADAEMANTIKSTSLSDTNAQCEPEPTEDNPEPTKDFETKPGGSLQASGIQASGVSQGASKGQLSLTDFADMMKQARILITEETEEDMSLLHDLLEEAKITRQEPVEALDDYRIDDISMKIKGLLHHMGCGPKPRPEYGLECFATSSFKQALLAAITRLENNEKIWKRCDPWLFCRATASEISILERKNKDERACFRHHNGSLVERTLHAIYLRTFSDILSDMKKWVDAECSWEHIEYFLDLFLHHLFSESFNNFHEDICSSIINDTVNSEISYLQSLIDFPLEFAVDRSLNIITDLANHLIPSQDLPADSIRTHESFGTIAKVKKDIMRIHKKIIKKMNAWPDSSREESFRKLEEKVRNNTADVYIRRQYNDLLNWRLVQIIRENGGVCHDARKSASLLEKLAGFHTQYATHIDTSCVLRKDLETAISCMARRVLSAIRERTDDSDELGKSLELIGDLNEQGYLDEECKELYMDCRQPPGVIGAIARADRITEDQCKQQIDQISLHMQESCHSECSYLVAADRLKQLLDEHEQTIETLDNKIDVKYDMEIIKQKLIKNLFQGIIRKFNKSKDEVSRHMEFDRRIDNPMNRHKPEFIQLRPFMFLLRDEAMRHDWQQAACFAWRKDIVRMSQAEEFSTEDIDQLLYLKEMAPTVPDPDIKPFLQSALANLLRFVKQDAKQENDTSISPDAEKITALRSWALDLDDLETDRFTSATPRPDHPEEWTPQTGQGPNKDDRSSP